MGGGKRKAKQNVTCPNKKPGCTLELGSPLKKKKAPCAIHDFLPEPTKQNARKGTGWCLDDIICEGYKRNCGKEFVEHLSEERIPGNGLVVSSKRPAYWCWVCKLVYCHECFDNMNKDAEATSGGRSARRRL